MAKLRICSPQLGISPDSNLGGEVFDRELLKGLANLGVEIDIILPLGKKHENHKNWNFYYLPVPVVYPPWLFNFLVLPYLFFIYHRHRFTFLRVQSPYFIGPTAVLFQLFHREVKLVASYLHLETNNILYDAIDRLTLNHYQLITAISWVTKKDIISRFHVNSRRIVIIPCGVDQKYRPYVKDPRLVRKYGLKDKTVLLYLGQLIDRKNIPFLFQVIKLLPESYKLMICGDGPLRRKLEASAPDGVIFTGRVEEDEKVSFYNLGDIFIYPSKKEGFGLSIAEASACGLPVVTFPGLVDNPDVIEVVEDEKLWAEKIMQLRYSKSNLNSKKYSWAKAASKYFSLLKNFKDETD